MRYYVDNGRREEFSRTPLPIRPNSRDELNFGTAGKFVVSKVYNIGTDQERAKLVYKKR